MDSRVNVAAVKGVKVVFPLHDFPVLALNFIWRRQLLVSTLPKHPLAPDFVHPKE